jgi:hypothetical protein
MEPTDPKIKSEAAWQFQHLIKKRFGATQQRGHWRQSGVEVAVVELFPSPLGSARR